jgi:deazaflavin-dependent oxidoreductase (nitroreductase family)
VPAIVMTLGGVGSMRSSCSRVRWAPAILQGPLVLAKDMPLTGEYELSPQGWVRDQTLKIFETGTTESVGIQGLSVILLTTRGVKSGKLRKVPLMRVEHDGVYAIVASLGGAPKNPTWYANVKAEPHVELQDGTVTRDYTAREVTGEEKALWWKRAVDAFPNYAEYQTKTDRQIPVFVLEPLAD